ncbi:hypothetical protein [Sedimentisphaera salicampi]|uniref:hypothetical protein n=1 Tax=Sedimentisphaera salicampi TaxID=1941349 RepID=UPI000B9B2026|nr:hypothetical protein [Sedimentisphaera salicampi]OXU14295.1 hypothetical protein SMSP1_02062 [Sedimentisphaera salicampi]
MFRKLIILLLAAGCSFAVTTKQIDDIRAASSLSDEDAQTLAAFIDQQFDEMLNADDLSGAVKAMDQLILRKPKEGQEQYKSQFVQTLKENIASVMNVVDTWEDKTFAAGFQVMMARMASQLDSSEFFQFARSLSESSQPSSRYWAVKICLTPNNLSTIKQGGAGSEELLAALKDMSAQEDTALVGRNVSKLCSELNNDDADDMLESLMNRRMEVYSKGEAKNEYCDAELFKAAASRIEAGNDSLKAPFTQTFAYIVEKYSIALSPENTLDKKSKAQLGALISEIEKNILPGLGVSDSSITSAIQKQDYQALQESYNKVFGGEDSEGLLPEQLGFTYQAGQTPQSLSI